MGWATEFIKRLEEGKTVRIRPRGNSMIPLIKSGQVATVEPLEGYPEVGDIVLCKVRGRQYLHLVKARRGKQFLIGNNRGGTNGWIGRRSIFGICTRVE